MNLAELWRRYVRDIKEQTQCILEPLHMSAYLVIESRGLSETSSEDSFYSM